WPWCWPGRGAADGRAAPAAALRNPLGGAAIGDAARRGVAAAGAAGEADRDAASTRAGGGTVPLPAPCASTPFPSFFTVKCDEGPLGGRLAMPLPARIGA